MKYEQIVSALNNWISLSQDNTKFSQIAEKKNEN